MQLPQAINVSAAGASSMPNFDASEEQIESRGKWAERIGVGPLIAIISLSIISAILTACCVAFYFIGTEFIKPTFDDQREAIKDTADAVKEMASSATASLEAMQGIKGHGEAQTKALESQTRALWELKTNSDKNIKLHEQLADSFDHLAAALQRNDVRKVGAPAANGDRSKVAPCV
jgi:hypothetical protein